MEVGKGNTKRNGTAIAPRLGVLYGSLPLLHYRYPRPTNEILTNIMNSLMAVPKLYTQVLHLMNKMNLPPPFGPVTKTPCLKPTKNERRRQKKEEKSQQELKKRKAILANLSSGESELESEHEKDKEHDPHNNSGSTKIEKTESTMRAWKKLKGETNSIKELNEGPEKIMNFSRNSISYVDEAIQCDEEFETLIPFKEIFQHKISEEDLQAMPAYKKYTLGDPSHVVYIKNLSKQVEVKDLENIFGHYERKSDLHINLMKEGRMKDQAFVTFSNVYLAKHALEDVHRFLLYDKPMIIQFAKGPKQKPPLPSSPS